jgi:hypothetical protein
MRAHALITLRTYLWELCVGVCQRALPVTPVYAAASHALAYLFAHNFLLLHALAYMFTLNFLLLEQVMVVWLTLGASTNGDTLSAFCVSICAFVPVKQAN